MNVFRNKCLVIVLLTITSWFVFLTFSVHAISRGITLKTKTSTGTVKEIPLYSGYYALVIGVSDYDWWPDLPNAANDAQSVAEKLKVMGFKVTTVLNPTSIEFKKALNDMTYEFGRDTNGALLFYYAGHGETEKLADGTKLGYIIPKDCPLLRDDPINFVNKAVSMKDIEAYSLRIRSKHVLMLFDSCFSGSIFSLVRAVPEDITEKSTLPVRQYITAGSEDETVPDRSMFKRCLMIGLDGDADLSRDGYITGTELGLFLADNVVKSTLRAQHPQYGKIRTPELARGDFIFHYTRSGAVIDRASKEKGGSFLSVESNISDARVFVDGQYVGSTNLTNIDISPGDHQIRVESEGYEPYTKEIRFESGRTRDLYVVLDPKAPLKARLYVDTKPEDSKVRILDIGEAFYQGMKLDAGRYHVEVSADGYELRKVWVTLFAGQDKSLDIHLKPVAVVQTVASKDKKITNSLGMEFNYIEPGTFIMGSPSDEAGRTKIEKQHQVTLTKGFYMQTTEVTQKQWQAVMGSNPSHFQKCGDDCPVESVSWDDVQDFIFKLNQREGGEIYRLPNEAEWEYAGRAGSTAAFASGGINETACGNDDHLNTIGWYCGNSNNTPHPAAQKQPNTWGLYDLHGNVWEWCQDWYGHYPSSAVSDPIGASSDSLRVIRGGSWNSHARHCRSAYRFMNVPNYKFYDLGFRLLRNP